VLYFRHLVGWKGFPSWFIKHAFGSLPVAAGAIGMGCIGFPAHPAWEVTAACNLRCIHCHVASNAPAEGELSTEDAKRVIDGLAAVDEFRMLVYTGGEPLVRSDIFELFRYSKQAGLTNVIATNGTLITEEVAFRMKDAGVVGAAVSIDSSEKNIHNLIRRKDNAFDLALRGIEALKKAGILLQINTTAMESNFKDIDNLVELANRVGAGIMLMYQLVPVGRGNAIGSDALNIGENEKLLTTLSGKQNGISTLIEPVAGPQYWPYLMERKGETGKRWLSMAGHFFHGCAAGRGFVYIKANGDVWPCPFVEVSAGSLKEKDFLDIWRKAEIFENLRNRENTLKGKCGNCRYSTICGGCRGRAMASCGDYLAEDPSCFLTSGQI